MSWNDLRQAGGVGDTEFFSFLSPKGTILSTTATVQNVLGFGPQELCTYCSTDFVARIG
jgi:hypothetical protein